jgi:hypothetical protein
MGDFRFDRLEKFRTGGTPDQMELEFPVPRSSSGKIHRRCPRPECVPAVFQLGEAPDARTIATDHASLVRRQPSAPGTTCPYCGGDAPDNDYLLKEDVEAAVEHVKWAAFEDMREMFSDMISDLNREFQSGPVSYQVSSHESDSSPPIVRRQDLLRSLTCDICSRSYGVYAAALFCPDCGARNIHVHFRREVHLIGQQIELAKKTAAGGDSELAYRLLGNAHEDVLSAFEAYHKVIYRFLVRRRLPAQAEDLCSKKTVGTRFQNIHRARDLYAKFGFDPYALLSENELKVLGANIEKRHVLGHNLGMIDESYAGLTRRGRPGETVPLLADEISRFAKICESVIVWLEEQSAEFLPPEVSKD